MAEGADGGQCANCGADAPQAYCPACGQKQRPALLPVTAWVEDTAELVTDLDGRALRSLRLLFTAPGQLSAEYAAGRVMSQTPPLRLYLVVSAAAIAIMSAFDYFAFLAAVNRLDADAAAEFQLLFPLINLLSPFLLAIALKVAWPRTLLHLHLVTAMHASTFIVIISLPVVGLLQYPALLAWAQLASLLVMAGWLLLALRRIHGSAWWRCALSAVFVTAAWIVVAIALQQGTLLLLR